MLSLAQAAKRRGAAGVPLPVVYDSFNAKQITIYRSQLCLIVGPASAGKSLVSANLIVKMRRPALVLLLDQDQATAVSRFIATENGEQFLEVKEHLDDYMDTLYGPLSHVQAAFRAEDASDIQLQVDAYVQRYGEPPEVLLVDNLGNMTSGFQDEGPILKALCLELDQMARDLEMAVIACHHTTDLITCEPAARDKILFKISHYPRLILSVGFNSWNGDYKIAAVKNSSGPTDQNAQNPVVLHADPARMQVTEKQQLHPQVSMTAEQRQRETARGFSLPDLRREREGLSDVRGFAGIG